MATLPPNTHAVSAIRERLAEVSGELTAIEKRWLTLREAHRALSQTLRMFDPDADSHSVKPKRPYRRIWPRDLGKMSRIVLDVLRLAENPMTMDDVVAALSERVRGTTGISSRVRVTLNRMARTGAVAKEGKRRLARWSLVRPLTPGRIRR